MSLANLQSHKFTHLINVDREMFSINVRPTAVILPHITADTTTTAVALPITSDTLTVDASDPSVQFETLDLHFGEHSYLMTVLPNIYRAVKFIEKSWDNSGKVLIGEEMGSQKAITLVIAFIMYKFRLKFVESFQVVKRLSVVSTVLDTYLIAQLCEYEPILETQRRAMLGSSCSSELRTARLKRKTSNSMIHKIAAELPILCSGGSNGASGISLINSFNNNNSSCSHTEPIQSMET